MTYMEIGGTIYKDGHVLETGAEIAEAIDELEPPMFDGNLINSLCRLGESVVSQYFGPCQNLLHVADPLRVGGVECGRDGIARPDFNGMKLCFRCYLEVSR